MPEEPYNQRFVQDTFYEPQGIHGIFTLSKGNAEAQKVIDNASAEMKKLIEQKRKIEDYFYLMIKAYDLKDKK